MTDLGFIIGVVLMIAAIPAFLLGLSLVTLSERRRRAAEDPRWRPSRFVTTLLLIQAILAGLALLGIGTCSGNVLINGLR